MSERRRTLRLKKVAQPSAEDIRNMLFQCNRKNLLIQCLIWREEEIPPPDVIEECMAEVERGVTPPLYQKLLEVVRPAVLIVNKNPLPVRGSEVLQDADLAIQKMKRVF